MHKKAWKAGGRKRKVPNPARLCALAHYRPAERGMHTMELKVFKDTVAAYGGRWETRLELPVET